MAPLNAEQQAYRDLAARMQDLIGQLGWDAYCVQLEKIEQDHISRMISGGKEHFEYLKGRIEGLREAVHFPAMIIQQAKGMTNE
jgi:hypothetical protein